MERNGLLEQMTCSQECLDDFWSQQNWKSNPQLQMLEALLGQPEKNLACKKMFFFGIVSFCSVTLHMPSLHCNPGGGYRPIPWLLHGDGAPFSEVDSLMVLSMRCAISHHSIKVSQLLLAALPKTASTKSSLKTIWEAIAGSFKKLADKKKGVLLCWQETWNTFLQSLDGQQP